MKLIVGLGNPGKQYEGTRHNMGFRVLDSFADRLGISFDREDFKGLYAIYKNPAFPEPLILLKPQTFMNLSGQSVQAISAYFHIAPQDMVIIFDDMAIPEGAIRLRKNGSSGSHKGIQNIIDMLGTSELPRIKIGIGEPPYNNAIDYVLGKPTGESLEKIDDAIRRATDALIKILTDGFAAAMNIYNQKGS